MITLRGNPASPGLAIGPAFHFWIPELRIERHTCLDPENEWARFEQALTTARGDLEILVERTTVECGCEQAAIFDAQIMMLDDPELLDAVRDAVLGGHASAEAALHEAADVFAAALASLDDPYLAARAADVRDVRDRVLRILLGVAVPISLCTPSIILAQDLAPSDTANLDKMLVLGFCTAGGGPTSHTAILARSLGLPAVVGADPRIMEIPEGAEVILDGDGGLLLAEADPATRAAYLDRRARAEARRAAALVSAQAPAVTADGRQVEVVANIGNVAGAQAALNAGAEGVGLLRTEFLYLERATLPSEEEQYAAYRAILETFGRRPVVLRTLDIGGDKELPYLELAREENPFLGVRAIRLCLAQPDLLRPQIRAALRASVAGNLKLMFPMVATVEEVRAARGLVDQWRDELVQEGHPVAIGVEIGIMVEIPSAALMADVLAREVDFFSIGTNDLTQYTLAADRTNAQVAALASAFHPAVLRLIKMVVDAAHARGKWVGLCGELAGEPLAIPILLGLGIDEFSMNPPAIPQAKALIRKLTTAEARRVAAGALRLESAPAVQAFARAALQPSAG